MSFLAAGKKDHLARLGEGGGGSELNGQCPFEMKFFFGRRLLLMMILCSGYMFTEKT